MQAPLRPPAHVCLPDSQNARWCDDILQEQVIEPAIVKVWQAFEKHMIRLAKGTQPERRLTLASGGAIERLCSGKHAEARSLLLQIHNMNALYLPFLAAGGDSALIAFVFAMGSTAAGASQEQNSDDE